MTARRGAQVALLAVVVVTLALVLWPREKEASVSDGASEDFGAEGASYVAYYFHGDRRCDTCRSIESQSEAAVREGFADELASGTLEWRTVNTDQPENAHFNEDFGLTHGTLVVAEQEGGETLRFTSLDRVWELVHEEDDQFRCYVQDEIASWMGSGS